MKKVALCLLVVVTAILTACSATAKPSLAPRAEFILKATDIAFDSTRLEVQAGQSVKVTLHNEGALEHDFSIMEIPYTGEVIGGDKVVAGHDEGHGHEGAESDIHVAAMPMGGRDTIEFTPSEPGEYEFVCTVAGHREAGMVGILVVRAP